MVADRNYSDSGSGLATERHYVETKNNEVLQFSVKELFSSVAEQLLGEEAIAETKVSESNEGYSDTSDKWSFGLNLTYFISAGLLFIAFAIAKKNDSFNFHPVTRALV